jgi:hypothetical protein
MQTSVGKDQIKYPVVERQMLKELIGLQHGNIYFDIAHHFKKNVPEYIPKCRQII